MALGRGLGAILDEVGKAYDVEHINLEDKKDAHNSIIKILDIHGAQFILEILTTQGNKLKKSQLVQGFYDDLKDKYPDKKSVELREITSQHFSISDKAVQKHIYSRKK